MKAYSAPGYVEYRGQASTIPPMVSDFDPEGEWEHTYRLWGDRNPSLSNNAGMLKLKRFRTDSQGNFQLRVHQTLFGTGGIINSIKVDIQCRQNTLASPISWEGRSEFLDPDGKADPLLGSAITGHIDFEKETNDIASNWSLFEAVQRLPLKAMQQRFDLLEGLSIRKAGHTLMFRENRQDRLTDPNLCLQSFIHWGEGIVPFQYFLDESHRLVMVICMQTAWILDDNAQEKLGQYIHHKPNA